MTLGIVQPSTYVSMLYNVESEAFAVWLEACGVDVVLEIFQERVVGPFDELAC